MNWLNCNNPLAGTTRRELLTTARTFGMSAFLLALQIAWTPLADATPAALRTHLHVGSSLATYSLPQPYNAYRTLLSSLLGTSPRIDTWNEHELSSDEKRSLLQAAQKAAFSLEWRDAANLASFVAGPSDEFGWQASSLAGYAYLQADQPQAAVASLESAFLSMSTDAPLRPFVGYWLTQAALEADRPGLAFVAGQFVETETLPVQLRTDHTMLVARAGAQRCVSVEDVQALRTALQLYPAYPLAATATTELAACLRQLGRPDLAANELEGLDRELPWLPVVRAAIDRHEQETGDAIRAFSVMNADEHIDWIRSIRFSRNWDLAETEFQRFLTLYEFSELTERTQNEFWFQRGLNAYESARFSVANDHFSNVSEGAAGLSGWLLAKYWALSESRIGQKEQALERVETYCASHPRASCQADIFEFAWDFGMYERAEQMLSAGEVTPLHPLQPGLLEFLRGDYEAASETFASLAASTDGHASLQATYWQARSRQQLGDTDAAESLFRRVLEARPFDYYALLSRGHLNGPSEGSASGEDAAQAAAGFRLRWSDADAPAATGGSSAAAFAEDVLAPIEQFASHWSHLFPAAKLALALAQIGAIEEARLVLRPAFREIEWRKQTTASNPLGVPWSAYSYRIDNRREDQSGWLGSHATDAPAAARSAAEVAAIALRFDDILHEATGAAEALSDCFMVRQFMDVDGRMLGPLESEALNANWNRFHCRPFAIRTRSLGERLNVSQELLWGLILAESAANPDSVSHAHAYGLMQVIPRTGTRIALGYGEEDFGVHQLLDPRESLKYGTWYLSQLLERFDGQEPLALVAYNAGPHQVARWLDWRGDGLPGDLFFETIPFSNSQNYAKKILRLAVTYRYFEHPDAQPFISNVLDAEDNDNIYY